MPEVVQQFKTEGEAREYLEEHTDEAVVLENDSGRRFAWLKVIDGTLRAVGIHPLMGPMPADIYGDDEPLDDDPTVTVEAVPADEAPFDWDSYPDE